MGKVIVGFVVGFIFWTVLWLGTDALMSFVPTIYPTTDIDGSLNVVPTTYLIIRLVLSVIFSILAGVIATIISGERWKSPLLLGVGLLLVGLIVQFGAWNILPLWYHLLFLILLVPMTLFGGLLRKPKEFEGLE